jgi:hypothetical protein
MKTLNKFILPFLLLVSVCTVAQERRPAKEKVEAMKVGFITERLNLSAEEAQSFWPVYNKYHDELEALRKNRRENIMNAKQNFDEMSDAELEKTVDSELGFRQSELDVQKKYHPQFKKVLPIKKVAKLYRAEEDFKRHLLDMIKEKREERGERRGPGRR